MGTENRRVVVLASLLLLLGSVFLCTAHSTEASTGQQAKRVTGEVIAVNTFDVPNTIVLRTVTGKNRELIIGATVNSNVEITRVNERVGLTDIRVGDTVSLTYVKTLDGLVARSITAREGGKTP